MKVAVYPGNVLALHMSKPHGFKYKSGQYIFVNCAAVSPFEWSVVFYLVFHYIISYKVSLSLVKTIYVHANRLYIMRDQILTN